MAEVERVPGEIAGFQNPDVAQELGRTGLDVCVFCSANDLDPKYTQPAKELARLLAENGHNFVWGGSDSGLMKEMASSAQASGAKLTGVSVEFLRHTARQNADVMIIAKDLGDRKATMLKMSDLLVVLVGGAGTIDEATEVIEHKKHGHHDKPIVFLNTDGFYDGFKIQMERMETDGFLPLPLEELVTFTAEPQEVIDLINELARAQQPEGSDA